MTHEHEHSHGHDHSHSHEHSHEQGPEHAHEHERSSTPAGDALMDCGLSAVLVNNWIDHNDGHRRTYLEWRDKLAAAGLPVTVSALEKVAELTDRMTAELRAAAAELGERLP